jgi:hypothetical protein
MADGRTVRWVVGAAVLLTVRGACLAEPLPAEIEDMFGAPEGRVSPAARTRGWSTGPADDLAAGFARSGPFHPGTAESARQFLGAYVPYTNMVESEVMGKVSKLASTPSYEKLNSIRKKVTLCHTGDYKRAMRLATVHISDFETCLGDRIEPASTVLRVSKSLYLVSLMDGSGLAYATFPIAYGANPDRGPKVERGDLRTPESPGGERGAGSTPFFARPLIDADPAADAGCISRGIGVSSTDARFDFLEDGWTVMLHGTPDRGCLGTLASHGCIRMLPEHIKVLFSYIRDGTPIVIDP